MPSLRRSQWVIRHLKSGLVLVWESRHQSSIKWRWGVSIPLPLVCETNALPSELHPLLFVCQESTCLGGSSDQGRIIVCRICRNKKQNASGGIRTHASLDSRSWDGPLRPLGHECLLSSLGGVVVSRRGVAGVSVVSKSVHQRSQERSRSTHIIRLAHHEEREQGGQSVEKGNREESGNIKD